MQAFGARDVSRRRALMTMAGASLGAPAAARPSSAPAGPPLAEPVKWSAGLERPRTVLPPGATDCHHHVYDSRYPVAPGTLRPGDALPADYERLRARLGISRHVVVQPSTYGVDNSLLVDALKQFGPGARGIAVVNTGVSDDELERLNAAGVRGLRFNLAQPGVTTLEMVEPLARRISRFGWHVQVNAPAAYLLDQRRTWRALPCPVVFDHLARIPSGDPSRDPAFALVCDLIHAERAYVKLSAFYIGSKVGPPRYADRAAVAAAFAQMAPQGLLWGTDWPHPTEQPDHIPDDAVLLDAFAAATTDPAVRNRTLVLNPERLFHFA